MTKIIINKNKKMVDVAVSITEIPLSPFTRDTSVLLRPDLEAPAKVPVRPTPKQVSGRVKKKGSVVEVMVGSTPPRVRKGPDYKKLVEAMDVLLEYLELFGFDRKGQKTTPTLDHWHLCSVECGWIKFLKYKSAAFFSMFLKDELPPKPFSAEDKPLQLIGGRAGRFIHSLLKGKNAREFAVGILFLKKGWPRPEKEDLRAALKDTFHVLTTVKDIPQTDIPRPLQGLDGESFSDELRVTLSDLEYQVRRTVREVFSGNKFTDEDLYRPYAPSVKSNYVSSRKGLGTYGTLKDLNFLADVPDFEYTDVFSVLDQSADAVPLIGINPDFEPLLKERYHSVYESVREALRVQKEMYGSNDVAVELVALAEALKVRVISKGPPLIYFLLKPLQKFMHSVMRKHKTFSLIGEPVKTEHFELFNRFIGDWLSIDYKAATDLLNPYLSWCAMDELCVVTEVPSDLSELAHLALTGHAVMKPGLPLGVIKLYKQLWGQLMGSIDSFPILCLVNAALCRYSYEIGEGGLAGWLDLHKTPLLVNGDDGLLRCSLSTKVVWQQISSLGGLQPSVGKVYFHPHYLNINSTSFWFSDQGFEPILYVNMGLVMGLTRSQGRVGQGLIALKQDGETVHEQSSGQSLGARHHELISSTPDFLRFKVHALFVKKHRDILDSVHVPWWVPESMGGVGLMPFVKGDRSGYLNDPVTGHRLGPSDIDLKCVRILLTSAKDLGPRALPNSQPIEARIVWYDKLPPGINKLYELKSKSEESFSSALVFKRNQDDLFGLLDTSTYYLQPSRVTEVLSDLKPSRILRGNERVWKRLLYLSQRMKNFQGFSVIEESYAYRRAKFIRPEKIRLGEMIELPDLESVHEPLVVGPDDVVLMDFDEPFPEWVEAY